MISVGLCLNYIYLPVFYDLQCTTCFTYLELRFDKQVKNLVSLLYTVSMLLFIPTVIYIPAIAFNQGKVILNHRLHVYNKKMPRIYIRPIKSAKAI